MSDCLVYSYNEEDFSYDTAEEAIESLINSYWSDDLEVGSEVSIYVGTAVKQVPSHFFGQCAVASLLEDAQYRAEDECGEFAEYFTECSKEAQEELETLIDSWADRHLKCGFYTVRDIREIQVTLTEEHFE